MQVEVYNALTNPQMNDTMRKRAILPRCFGGIVPGSSPAAAAAYVASAGQVEAFVGKTENHALQGAQEAVEVRHALRRRAHVPAAAARLEAHDVAGEGRGSWCSSNFPSGSGRSFPKATV